MPYDKILAVLRDVPKHPDVTPIAPVEYPGLSFFPGHCGFIGESFPVGGVMVVGNNFDKLEGWEKFKNVPKADTTRTTVNLQKILADAGIPLVDCWFTNYALGVMDKPSMVYAFPAKVRKALRLQEAFEQCVSIMRPRLMVALGAYVRNYLGLDNSNVFEKFGTRVIAIPHPSAWVGVNWEAEALRIREALNTG